MQMQSCSRSCWEPVAFGAYLEELSSHGKSWKTCIEYPESDGLRAQGAERRGLRGV